MSAVRSVGKGVKAALIVLGVVALLSLFGGVSGLLPSFDNPFETEERERPHSALLKDLRDVSEYTAASGEFQVIVDSEKDTKYVPDFVKGERVVLIAEGSVDAVVDFRGLKGDAVKESADGKTVTITLPKPELTKPRIDPGRTEVTSRDRGLIDRVEDALQDDPTDDQGLYRSASEKLADAAAESELIERAETNTRQMLQGFLGNLGFEDVEVRFVERTEP